MDVLSLVDLIKNSTQHNYLYHFTDESNFKTIKEHGLLSKSELSRIGLTPAAFGGNDWSHDADRKKGILDYVNLCLTRNHPMCYLAKNDERIPNPRYLAIDPDILLVEGVRVALGVANRSDVEIYSINEAIKIMDLEVLYSRTDWRDPNVNARLKAAEKYEVLVPKSVPLNKILKAF